MRHEDIHWQPAHLFRSKYGQIRELVDLLVGWFALGRLFVLRPPGGAMPSALLPSLLPVIQKSMSLKYDTLFPTPSLPRLPTKPEPYTLHPTTYTLYPTLYTLRHAPNTLHPTSYSLDPTPYTLHPSPHYLLSTPYTLLPTPYTLLPTPFTLHHTPYTLHPTPFTPHPTHYTLHPARVPEFRSVAFELRTLHLGLLDP